MAIIRHKCIKWDPKRDWKQNLKRSIEWRESQIMQYVHIEQPKSSSRRDFLMRMGIQQQINSCLPLLCK